MHEFDESAESSVPPDSSPPSALPPVFGDAPPLRDILLVYSFSCVLLLVVGGLLQGFDVLSGLLVTEFILILWPPAWYVWRRQYPFRLSFHLAPTTLLNGVLSMLSAVAVFVLVGGLAQLQECVLPRSEAYQEFWQQTLQQFHRFPLPMTLLVMAVLPGVCEELFFRGFMLWGFRAACSNRAAIVWVGVLFGIFHFDPYRFVPVTLLGILFGYLTVQTNSILPAMLAHMTNNAIAVSASYVLMEYQGGDGPLEALPDGSCGHIAGTLLPMMFWAFGGLLLIISLLRRVNPPLARKSSGIA